MSSEPKAHPALLYQSILTCTANLELNKVNCSSSATQLSLPLPLSSHHPRVKWLHVSVLHSAASPSLMMAEPDLTLGPRGFTCTPCTLPAVLHTRPPWSCPSELKPTLWITHLNWRFYRYHFFFFFRNCSKGFLTRFDSFTFPYITFSGWSLSV